MWVLCRYYVVFMGALCGLDMFFLKSIGLLKNLPSRPDINLSSPLNIPYHRRLLRTHSPYFRVPRFLALDIGPPGIHVGAEDPPSAVDYPRLAAAGKWVFRQVALKGADTHAEHVGHLLLGSKKVLFDIYHSCGRCGGGVAGRLACGLGDICTAISRADASFPSSPRFSTMSSATSCRTPQSQR